MEENSLAPKKDKLSKLAFLEIGLFEIVFVTVGFLLLFGTLNYFNILPVSDVFPKYLGWLPRREVPTGTFPKQQAPTVILYNSTNSARLLTEFIRTNLRQEVLPQEIVTHKDQQPNGEISMALWGYSAPTATFSAYIHYRENTAIANDIKLFILISDNKTSGSKANASLANGQVAQYLSNTQSISDSDCHENKNISYCQIFKEQENGKAGFGFAIYNNLPSSPKTVFSCLIPKGSEDYNTATGCISL